MSQRKIGNRQLQFKYVQICKNFSGKDAYIYTKPGCESTIFEYDEVEDIKEIIQEQKIVKQQLNPETKYNLITKNPTNLTIIEKKREEKLRQMMQHGPRTQISRDIVPSQIFCQDIPQCFKCIDKNQEIIDLRSSMQNLRRQYEAKLRMKDSQINALSCKYAMLLKQNEQIAQNAKNTQNQKIDLLARFMKLSQEHKSCQKEITKNKMPSKTEKMPSYQLIDNMVKQHKQFKSKIQELQATNRLLKRNVSAKDSQIRDLRQSLAIQLNPEPSQPTFKKNRQSFSQCSSSFTESFTQNSSSITVKRKSIEDSYIIDPDEDQSLDLIEQ